MFVEKNTFQVRARNEAEFEKLMLEIRSLARIDPTVISVRLYKSLNNPSEYMAINEYRLEEDDLASHRQPKVQEIRTKLAATLNSETRRERYISLW